MRTSILIAATAATLAGCMRPTVSPQSTFAAETTGRIAGTPQSCIMTNAAGNIRIIDAQTVAYGMGRTIYVNRLPAACPGMRELNTLIIQPSLGGQYCRGDLVRAVEPGAIIPGPTCILGDWTPYRLP